MGGERYRRGFARLQEVHGALGEDVLDKLREVAPDFADMVIAFPYGDLHSRPGLPARDRQMAIVSALAAMGNAEEELRIHMRGALNVGVTREELVELLMQLAPYAGFPVVLNALMTARALFADLDAAEAPAG